MNIESEKSDLSFEKIESEEVDQEKDTAEYKLNTFGVDFTLEILSQKLDSGEISIPSFQRRYVWPEKKASKLIESFLLNLPVPQVFLYRQADTQTLLVVDGQQRLKSVNYFLRGFFDGGKKFYLKTVKDRWEGKTYEDLDEPEKRKLKNYVLRATIFEQTDPADHSSVYEIFKRLNTGGMALTEQEIRNCIVQGPVNDLLEELNLNKDWRILLGKSDPDSRMKDVEMILRFWALKDKNSWRNYKKPMKDFITGFMEQKKNINKEEAEDFSFEFSAVVKKLNNEVGSGVFRIKSGINIALFDAIVVALSSVGVKKIKKLSEKISQLKMDKAFLEAVEKSTTDADRVQSRIKIAIEAFSK